MLKTRYNPIKLTSNKWQISNFCILRAVAFYSTDTKMSWHLVRFITSTSDDIMNSRHFVHDAWHKIIECRLINPHVFVRKNHKGVNFINLLRAAFTQKEPKFAKKTVRSSVSFALLGPTQIKAARKMLMKLTQDLPTLVFNTFFYYICFLCRSLSSYRNILEDMELLKWNVFNIPIEKMSH